MSPKVQKIFDFMADHDVEIVSFGIAPNPFGFCYERGENASDKDCKKFDGMLKRLTVSEERELKKEIFG